VSAELELAERALGFLEGDGQVTVTRERALHARFARSAPTQATDVEDVAVHVLAVRDGHPGAASTNVLDDDALRAAARRAEEAARSAAGFRTAGTRAGT
jgi:predicted Zn-dependent protease